MVDIFDINVTQHNPSYAVEEQSFNIAEYMVEYCAKVDNAIFWYIGIYGSLTIFLLALYRFDKLTLEQYADYSNRLQTSYVIMSIIFFLYLWFTRG